MQIDPEHEKAYSPSAWSKRFGHEEIISHFIQMGRRVTNKARSSVSCNLDISYGISDRAKYDVYGDDLPNDASIFIFIHGGYWQELDKQVTGFHVENLVSNGIKVFNVGYSLCPSVTLSDIVSQIKSVVEKILEQARNIGSKNVWIGGHSAGAHLAASLIHDVEWFHSIEQNGYSKLIKGLALIAGIYNLEPLLRTSYNKALKLTSDELKNFSFGSLEMANNRLIRDIKVIVTVGEYDAPIFVKESKLYAKKLIDYVDNVEFTLIRDIDHFDIVENLTDSNFALTKLLIRRVNAH